MTDDPVVLVGRALARKRDDFISRLVSTTEAEIAALEHDETLRGLLDASITENVVTFLHVLTHGLDPATVDAPASALSYARRLAQRDVSLSAPLRAYRIGQGQGLDLVTTEAFTLHLPDPATTVVRLVTLVNTFMDRVCDQVGRAYEEERERWLSSRGALRQYWVGQVLDNPAVDARQAERALDHRLTGHHLAVEVWLDPRERPTDPAIVFDRVVPLLHTELEARGAALVVPVDEAGIRVWLPVRPGATTDPYRVSAALADAGLPARVALGPVREGLDGFRRTARSAARTKALAIEAGPAAPRAVAFTDVAPVALLVDDARELADFVSDALGDLALDDPRHAMLRETLRVFLAANRSYATTAERLTVHRNTVHYRIQKAVEALGTSLDDNPFRLGFALDICHWYGRRVLRRAA
ncbi:PucR family transcriptional regulator [Streptomyces diastatochromogenes]|uniref:PucR family transcriptional regulator n=1 Tax=Streptomyces diastatochromogenes TaxID=42236 RepID=A0A233S1L3_STRDA|nr:helix-turn-helix domain-containing protein [Streptomyces diastatochromogenes]OXY89555.1 hypothetical protein BEK98_38060 [Streptomyces diastatochromogenes]